MNGLWTSTYTNDAESFMNIIKNFNKDELKDFVRIKRNDTTMLHVCCCKNYIEIATLLLLDCDADIDQTGTIIMDGEKTYDVTPLWCAAAKGHFELVRLLVENGANINSTTHTNSTPLRAACFDGHFNIVKYLVENGADVEIANNFGHTCLMIACYKGHADIAKYLIDYGCQVNRQSLKGNTALHDCVDSRDLEILGKLIKNGALLKPNCYGLTPLMCAAKKGNLPVFTFLKSVFKCTIEEITDAYKLLGIIECKEFTEFTSNKCAEFWRKAATLFHKCNDKYKDSVRLKGDEFCKAYDGVKEFANLDDLEIILSNPDFVKIQSAIIFERILGICHPETFFFISRLGEFYINCGEYSKCLQLWMYNLERQMKNSSNSGDIVEKSFELIIKLFSCMQFIRGLNYEDDIQKVLKWAMIRMHNLHNIEQIEGKNVKKHIKNLMASKQKFYFRFEQFKLNESFIIILHLIIAILKCTSKFVKGELENLSQIMEEFLSRDLRSSSSLSLLHIISIIVSEMGKFIVSSRGYYNLNITHVELLIIFKLIVSNCSNLNLVDIAGNTALHYLVKNNAPPHLIQYLIDSGAHIDILNDYGETPFDLLNPNSHTFNYLHQYRISRNSLQCLCAQVIIKSNIDTKNLPDNLEQFVKLHKFSQKEIQ